MPGTTISHRRKRREGRKGNETKPRKDWFDDDDDDDDYDFIEVAENRKQQEEDEWKKKKLGIAKKFKIAYVDDDTEWFKSLGNYMKKVKQEGIVDGTKGLDEDYNVFIKKYNKREKYDETKVYIVGGINISAREAYTLGLMQRARTDMKWLYQDFHLNRERIKKTKAIGDDDDGDYDIKLTRMITDLEKEFNALKNIKKKIHLPGADETPFPYCPPLNKKKNVITSSTNFKGEKEKKFIENWLLFCERREEKIREKKEVDLKALYAKFPDEFRSLNIPIDKIEEIDKRLTDNTILDWIKLKTEKKKGGRKRTRRKKRRRKSTKKKRRRKRKRTKKKRRRRRR